MPMMWTRRGFGAMFEGEDRWVWDPRKKIFLNESSVVDALKKKEFERPVKVRIVEFDYKLWTDGTIRYLPEKVSKCGRPRAYEPKGPSRPSPRQTSRPRPS